MQVNESMMDEIRPWGVREELTSIKLVETWARVQKKNPSSIVTEGREKIMSVSSASLQV